jgi:broad specificity phosphatase PhoE
MGNLYLIRHGQASFGAVDYDQLSELGQRQCRRLGEYFRTKGIVFDGIVRGTLKRHQQSLDAILEGLAPTTSPLVQAWSALNEYDADALIRTVYDGELGSPDNPEAYRAHFRLLREALVAWMEGRTAPQGMPSHADWVAGIAAVLDDVRRNHAGNVLMVSSGGPIATAVSHVLGAPTTTTIELNLRIRNSAVTEFAFSPRRHALLSFNHLPHLDPPEFADWVTYA